MASLLGPVVDELEALVGSSTVGGAVARGLLSGAAGIAAIDLINAFTHSSPQTKAKHANLQFALVDLANNRTITFLSRKRVYRLLTRSRSRKARSVRIITVGGNGSPVNSSLPESIVVR